MLVLMPGYKDIEEMAGRLKSIGTTLYVHRRGSNINDLRKKFIDNVGIMLTVYWEGFNIVGTSAPPRRGLIDKLVISRLPYGQPNPTKKDRFKYVYGDKAEGWIHMMNTTEVIRRTYQGIGRAIRGTYDSCNTIFCDGRFPYPKVMLDANPLLRNQPGKKSLIEAIPLRFRNNPKNFVLKLLP
jgi:Rad3-related DNA helicase